MKTLSDLLSNDNPDLKTEARETFQRVLNNERDSPADGTISFAEVIEKLKLTRLPSVEGGFYYQFTDKLAQHRRQVSNTTIFYLMVEEEVSCLHRVKDTIETWNWLGGSHVALHIFPQDVLQVTTVILNEDNPTFAVPRNVLFGAENMSKEDGCFSLVFCTCCPGFTMSNFMKPSKKEVNRLRKKHLSNALVIDRLTAQAPHAKYANHFQIMFQ